MTANVKVLWLNGNSGLLCMDIILYTVADLSTDLLQPVFIVASLCLLSSGCYVIEVKCNQMSMRIMIRMGMYFSCLDY